MTDTHLLHLAGSRNLLLATFDNRVVTAAVPARSDVLLPIL